ncbi:metallophosphoesterase [Piscinibacter gummiphilus]|uniref:Metallophosphoesterase n=1 Tax=Piscinibacter gummiphilus TaxID=946333 RepID=A0ABZ0CTK1_9BURK|nr:metallophosphoesterase [Piscinibacter gummiphilus]WOB08282.1 metallophosphoesterase [Piscinibacter gummiphilus]
MRVQLLSDLHLETEDFQPLPAPGAELLILGGDIDSTWQGLAHFRDWPVPVLMVAGNHEFDDRDVADTWPVLRAHCEALGIRLLERESLVLSDAQGRRIRFVSTVRWCDFDAFGEAQREKSMRAGHYFMRVQRSTFGGQPFDAALVREEALACKAWLAQALAQQPTAWDTTVALTHFAPSLRSADPRYGHQSGTASFCNADDELLPLADVWIHGHLHCRHDYTVGRTRVVCNARGHARRGEAEGYDPLFVLDV